MAAIGFLLGRRVARKGASQPAGFKMLEQGDSTTLRRKFKMLANTKSEHDLEEVFFFTSRGGEMKRKRFARGEVGEKVIKKTSPEQATDKEDLQ